MEPVDVILGVLNEIEQLRKEGRTWQEIQSAIPALQAIGLATVKQYGRVVLEVKHGLAKDDKLNTVRQVLEAVRQELNIKREELAKVIQELDQVKQELANSQSELYRVKQELEEVKQKLDKSEELNTVSQERLDKVIQSEQVSQKLNKHDPGSKVKQRLSIADWNIQQDRQGYYRAFKKIGGKLRAVYLGRSLEGAEDRIRAKEAEVRQG
jgi:septal ring factor EnvC (AmiA/AmiB activator)